MGKFGSTVGKVICSIRSRHKMGPAQVWSRTAASELVMDPYVACRICGEGLPEYGQLVPEGTIIGR